MDLTYSAFRRHPVTQALRFAALGAIPTERDLDELQLPADARRNLVDAAGLAASLKSGGENGAARQAADDAADRILAALPPALQDPDYLKEPEPDITDPAELAARVGRW